MQVRDLPLDLAKALTRARDLESLASECSGLFAQRHAINGTGALMLAAVEAGWAMTELAAVTGLSRVTVAKRVRVARELHDGVRPGLVLDGPLSAPFRPRDVIAQPVETREWLTRSEAADLAGCHPHTIHNWARAGLLPNTRTDGIPHLFLRADVVRVMRGARYNELGVSYAVLRDVIASARA